MENFFRKVLDKFSEVLYIVRVPQKRQKQAPLAQLVEQ